MPLGVCHLACATRRVPLGVCTSCVTPPWSPTPAPPRRRPRGGAGDEPLPSERQHVQGVRRVRVLLRDQDGAHGPHLGPPLRIVRVPFLSNRKKTGGTVQCESAAPVCEACRFPCMLAPPLSPLSLSPYPPLCTHPSVSIAGTWRYPRCASWTRATCPTTTDSPGNKPANTGRQAPIYMVLLSTWLHPCPPSCSLPRLLQCASCVNTSPRLHLHLRCLRLRPPPNGLHSSPPLSCMHRPPGPLSRASASRSSSL